MAITDTFRKQRPDRAFHRECSFSEDVDKNLVCVVAAGVASKPTAAWQRPAGVTEHKFFSDQEDGELVTKLIMKCIAGEAITADQPLGIYNTSGHVGLCPHGKPMVGRSMDAQATTGSYVSVWLEELGQICDRSGETTAVAGATYTVLKTDYRLLVSYTATGTVAITLPTALLGVVTRLEIVDTGDNANNNNITIATEGSEEIAGAATATMSTASGTLVLTNDGSDWFSL